MVEALFAELNRRGGIYGRRLVLRSGTLPAAPPQRVEALRRFLETEKPFALVGMVLGGEEDGVPELLGELQVPLVGALSAFPSTKQPVPRYIFYLYSGVAEQAQVLMEFAGRRRHKRAYRHRPSRQPGPG
jgi:ABC-type branched-subunit amino acid transport system substrate-binding protein